MTDTQDKQPEATFALALTEEAATLTCTGELTTACLMPLRKHLTNAIAWACRPECVRELIVDLQAVVYMDSAALERLLETRRQMKACSHTLRVRVTTGSPPDRVLIVTQVDRVVTMERF